MLIHMMDTVPTISIKMEPLEICQGDDEISRGASPPRTLSGNPSCMAMIKIEPDANLTMETGPSVGVASFDSIHVKEEWIDDVKEEGRITTDDLNLSNETETGKSELLKIAVDLENEIGSSPKEYSCYICSYSCEQKAQLRPHMKIHFKGKPSKSKCPEIAHSQPDQLKGVPGEEKTFSCDVCEKIFSHASNWKRHKKIHAGQKTFSCDVCETRFSRADHLKNHKRVHTREKPFTCDVCGNGFSEAGHLKRHMRTHTGDKPYICHICDAKFIEAGTLKRHMRVHTGEKPYTCNTCATGFSEACALTRHMWVHTGEKHFSCSVCETRFKEMGHLKRHMRIHTGEKPFICNICETRFGVAGSLKRHMRVHTV